MAPLEDDARRRARRVLGEGIIKYSQHCRERLCERDLTTVDCENALRGGVYQLDGNGFQARTGHLTVCFTFLDDGGILIKTAWRNS
jgi:hypothetical protein